MLQSRQSTRTQIQEVPGSILNWRVAIQTENYTSVLCHARKMLGQYLKVGHLHFLPHTSNSLFTIHATIQHYSFWATESILKWNRIKSNCEPEVFHGYPPFLQANVINIPQKKVVTLASLHMQYLRFSWQYLG